MSKEIHVKKRCPNVIDRLLGKEGISLQQHVNKQPETPFLSYQFDVQKKSRQYDDFSNSRISSNREAFKDVYEDLDTPNCNRRTSTKWSAKAMLTKHELALIQQSSEASSSRGSRRITVLEPSDCIKYESRSKAWNLTDPCITSPLQRRDGLLLEPHISRSEENSHPGEIVVLKPNIQNTRDCAVLKRTKDNAKEIEARQTARTITRRLKNRSASMDATCSDYKGYDVLKRTKDNAKEIEARQTARTITRRLKNRSASMDANCSDYKGYDGDVSDSDALRVLSSKSFGDIKLCRYPPSLTLAQTSSANKKAKQRTCERWKITQEYRDLELSADDITLGELLATDRERRSICISSRDGWKFEKSATPSSSSRSLLPSKDKRSHRINHYIRKDGFSNRGSKSMIRKSSHCRNPFIKETDSHLEASFEIRMEANVKDISVQHHMLHMAPNDDTCKLSANEGIMEATGDKASQNQHDSDRQELQKGSKPESSVSSTDADCDRESPVSVLLELPFPGDNVSSSSSSGYQCVERVSAALNDIRMHLESLTIPSGDIAPMDEEFVEFCPIPYEGNYALRMVNWETTYALDVLIGSGLENCGFDMLKTNWHSPDFPLDPTLFDDLENKYNTGEATGLLSERKFLFDRINFALVEIFQEHGDLFPWVTRIFTGAFKCLKHKDWIRVALKDKMNEYFLERVKSEREVDRETQWSDCKGEMEVIVNEIESLLINDMIAEVFFKV